MTRLFNLFLSALIIGLSAVSLFFSYVLLSAIWSKDGFVIVPSFLREKTTIEAIYPSDPALMTDAQESHILSLLIEDYLVYRYTVLPDANLMGQRLGTWWQQGKKELFEAPYALWAAGSEDSEVWKRFKDPTAGFASTVLPMVKEGQTRSVQILSAPEKDKDFWNIRLKLSTYYPEKDTFEETYLKVKLNVFIQDGFRWNSAQKYHPALFYKFFIRSFQENYDMH